jgi:cytoskeleton protein RodZ
LTRTLAAGDRVPVPDLPGLTLFTGNAGGVEILLDGRALPALGAVGAVRRNISLDIKALQQGRAGE